MSGFRKRWLSEVLFTLLSCAMMIAALWAYDSWGRRRVAQEKFAPSKPLVQSGANITLEGVDFSKAPVNLILVTSPTCKYCQASERFHSRLLNIGRNSNVPIYVMVPSRKGASAYLKDLTASESEAREYSQMNLAIKGTPTILSVDNLGHVRDVWIGLATPGDESEIVDEVQSKSFSAKVDTGMGVQDFPSTDLSGLKQKSQVQLLNVAERELAGSEAGSTNIPLQELPLRARFELDKSKLQVVDCTRVSRTSCGSAVKALTQMHFNTATIGADTYRFRCKFTSPDVSAISDRTGMPSAGTFSTRTFHA